MYCSNVQGRIRITNNENVSLVHELSVVNMRLVEHNLVETFSEILVLISYAKFIATYSAVFGSSGSVITGW